MSLASAVPLNEFYGGVLVVVWITCVSILLIWIGESLWKFAKYLLRRWGQ